MAFTDLGIPMPDERSVRDLDIPIEEITSMSPRDRFNSQYFIDIQWQKFN